MKDFNTPKKFYYNQGWGSVEVRTDCKTKEEREQCELAAQREAEQKDQEIADKKRKRDIKETFQKAVGHKKRHSWHHAFKRGVPSGKIFKNKEGESDWVVQLEKIQDDVEKKQARKKIAGARRSLFD